VFKKVGNERIDLLAVCDKLPCDGKVLENEMILKM
jgi:hypothetical protein